jgi:hypothetical protein
LAVTDRDIRPFSPFPFWRKPFHKGWKYWMPPSANVCAKLRGGREALELEDPQFSELHGAWIDEVLSRGLELDEDGKGDVLKRADWCAGNLQASLPEHGVTLSPRSCGNRRATRQQASC